MVENLIKGKSYFDLENILKIYVFLMELNL